MTPLGDPALVTSSTARPTPILKSYYVYGVLQDIGRNWGGDFDVLVAENVTLFGEYSRERNTNRMVSRQRSANTASQVGCPSRTNPADCDPINYWTTFTKDVVDTYSLGADVSLPKKADLSVYDSRSSVNGAMLTDGVNCQIGSGPNGYCRANFPNWRLDSAASPVATFDFPDTSSRLQVGQRHRAVQGDGRAASEAQLPLSALRIPDFQTSVINPFAYVGPAADPGGATGLQRMLFLGADTPGYNAHIFSVTLEYRV